MIFYVENQNWPKQTAETNNYSKVAGYIVNKQKSVTFLDTIDKCGIWS